MNSKNFKSDFLIHLKKHNKVSPTWTVHFTTDLFIICDFATVRTVILSQLLYLCDKGKRKDGYFYKSHKELIEETGASRRAIIYAVDWFEERGFLEVKIKKVLGRPTSHYRIDRGALWSYGKAKMLEHNNKNRVF